MDINRLHNFCILYEAKGFQEASRKNKINASSIRKKLLSLETELGIQLIETSSGHKITFTNAAHKFYNEALQIVDYTNSRLNNFIAKHSEYDDRIVVATTHAVASLWLPSIVPKFRILFPNTQLIVKSSDEKFNLYQREADVSIGLRDQSNQIADEESMKQLPLTEYHMNLYASSDYIKRFGLPLTVKDLKKFTIIGFGKDIPYPYPSVNWHLKYLPDAGFPQVQVNSGVAILKLVQSGIGIGSVSQKGYEVSEPKLVRILPEELEGPIIDVLYNYPKIREGEPLIMQLYELLKACL